MQQPALVRRFTSPRTVLRGASNRRARSVRLWSSSASSSSAARMSACNLDRKIGSNAGATLLIARKYLRSNLSVIPTRVELPSLLPGEARWLCTYSCASCPRRPRRRSPRAAYLRRCGPSTPALAAGSAGPPSISAGQGMGRRARAVPSLPRALSTWNPAARGPRRLGRSGSRVQFLACQCARIAIRCGARLGRSR